MLIAFCLSVALAFWQPTTAGFQAQIRDRISGRVASLNDKPIENARVTLVSVRMTEAVVYTDSSGRYTFEGVAKGIYEILVESSGADYERQSAQIDTTPTFPGAVGRGGTYRIDFVLKPSVKLNRNKPASDNVLFYQKVPDAAKKEYNRAVEVLKKKADFETAAMSLRRALEIFPDYYDALEMLGTEYVKRGDYQSSLPLLTRAVEIYRSDWRSFFALGIALAELKQPDKALEPLGRAVELNPISPHARMRLAVVIGEDEARRAEAIELLKEAIELGSGSIPDAFLHLAYFYNKNGQYREAADTLETYLRKVPESDLKPDQRDYYKNHLERLRQKASAASKSNQ